MTPERWQQITAVFHAALACEPSDRERFLAEACGTDAALRHEVDRMVAGHEDAGQFGEVPLVPAVSQLCVSSAPAVTESVSASLVGQTVSHYRILGELGDGGMGVVYKALDLRLNRFVALKFLVPDRIRDQDANDRFRREAQAASALDHANICTIHEIDETPDHRMFLTMAYYKGETLRQRIGHGPLPVADALDIAVQVAHGLSCAHASNVVHRDIKPANIMIGAEGLVKILDFGIAKLADGPDSMAGEPTLAGRSALTRTGTTPGTVAYMSPEQIRVSEVDARTDLWALGVVLYEMLASHRPFDGADDSAVSAHIVGDTPQPIEMIRADVPRQLQLIVSRALEKDVAARFSSAAEMARDLMACRAAITEQPVGSTELLRVLRKPAFAVPVAALVLVLGVLALLAASEARRTSRTRRAREEALPELMRRIQADDAAGAFALAKEIERDLPGDPVLAGLWPRFSATGSIQTVPDGAAVYVQDYSAKQDTWKYVGRTPIKNARMHLGAFRVRVEKDGYETQTLATTNPGTLLQNASNRLARPMIITLLKKGTHPEMVSVPGGAYPVSLAGFSSGNLVRLDPFFIDQYEVTNRKFKQFIDSGGFTRQEYWRGLSFGQPGDESSWQQLVSQFRDSTGRPGPAGWALGEYPSGQDDYPVGGVSWYEAAAYCHFEKKSLPTIFHWARAALSPDEMFSPLANAIIPLSNFGTRGPAPVGRFRGMGPYGTYDMEGNVREWCWNESSNMRRFILGGAWNDPAYMTIRPYTEPALDRSPTNGFRCAQYQSAGGNPELQRPVQVLVRDYRAARAVSDEIFQVFKRQFSYDKSDLSPRLESRDTTANDWIREKFSFDAKYERGRVPAYLFLPRDGKPPYQLVVYFPSLTSFVGRPSSETLQPDNGAVGGSLDYIIKSGRALVWPVYKGSYERWDAATTPRGDAAQAARTRMMNWRQDLGQVLDVLSPRKDIDGQRVAYMGASFGASNTLPLLALEDRLTVAVLLAAGLSGADAVPETDAVNYVSHVTIPVLMLGGRNDYIYPVETSKQPLFERLGTPLGHKRQVIFDAGHADLPRNEMIHEVLAWLDRYLGPVGGPSKIERP